MKKILDLTNDEAKNFFLKSENYFNLDLPIYFDLQSILNKSILIVSSKHLSDLCIKSDKNKTVFPKEYEEVNCKIINNKNGKYDWRQIELIHPILYVDLVNEICSKENWLIIKKRFKKLQSNKKIKCCSIPPAVTSKGQNIKNWWKNFEQEAISCGLEFNSMASTDITNCYGSIYTHSIPWAIYSKEIAKADQSSDTLGNNIDKKIRNMTYGQTNGIPQGSVLMDFIAEIVLGYCDELLTAELRKENIKDYKILRYRDDYKIFANNSTDLDKILKIVTEVLEQMNFKLNTNKTFVATDLINGILKPDKQYVIQNPIDQSLSVQKKLYAIYNFSLNFPNSGSLKTLLTNLYISDFENKTTRYNSYDQLISIIVQIMYRNPSTYGICVSILSSIFKFVKQEKRNKYIDIILKKFNNIPNSDYLDIWLQRLTIVDNPNKEYKSLICKKMYQKTIIWNSNWLNCSFDESVIINYDLISNISAHMTKEEVNSFKIHFDS